MAISEALIGAAASIGTAALSRKWAQQDFKRNQGILYAQAQAAERNSAQNRVAGAKMAGLSPALMNGGNFTPVSTPTAPMLASNIDVAAGAGAGLAAAQQSELIEAQKENIQAQTNKLESETDDTNIDVQRKKSADEWTARFLKNVYPKDYATFKKEHPNEEPDISYFTARKGFVDALVRDSEANMQISQNKFDEYVADLKRADSEIAMAVAELPLNAQMELFSRVDHLNALVQLTNAKTDLTEDERKKITAEISNLTARTADVLTENPAAAKLIGNNKAALYGSIQKVVGLGVDVVKVAAGAASFGKFGAAASAVKAGAAKAAAGSGQSRSPIWNGKRPKTREEIDRENSPFRNYR